MPNIISVEFMVPAGVQIDMDTGEVVRVVVWSEQFNWGSKPDQLYTGQYEAEGLPDPLPENHPLYVKAMEICDRVNVTQGEMLPAYEIKETS